MAKPRIVTKKMEVEINKLYDEGRGVVHVAQIFKVDAKTIRSYIDNPRPIGRPKKSTCLTDEDIIKINKLYNEGKSCKELAKMFYVSAPTVSRYIKKHKHSHNSLKFTVKDLQEINRLYDEGKTSKQIAEIYNCSKSTIATRIWKPRRRGQIVEI